MKSEPRRVTLRLPPDLVDRVEALAPRLAVPGVHVGLNDAFTVVLTLGIDAAEAKYPPRPSTESP